MMIWLVLNEEEKEDEQRKWRRNVCAHAILKVNFF